MPKRLSGSAGTGKKIMQNLDQFRYTYNGAEKLSEDKTLYKFNWSFNNYQSGYISIELLPDKRISQFSLMGRDNNKKEFASTLGAYNDSSLYNIFGIMLDSQNISHK